MLHKAVNTVEIYDEAINKWRIAKPMVSSSLDL